MKVSFRIACPGDDRRAYLVYEEQMKVNRKEIPLKDAKGFYWTDEIKDHPVLEPLKGINDYNKIMEILPTIEMPNDSELPEGYHYQAMRINGYLTYAYDIDHPAVSTVVNIKHNVTKESYVKERR